MRKMYNYPRELYHFGIPHRSGRYPWGSGSRPYQSEEAKKERLSNRASRINQRTTKKFSRLEKGITKRQKKADKEFNKAEKKSVSYFSTQRGIDRAMDRAIVAQRRVHNLEYKGGQYYKKQKAKLDKMSMSMNSDLQEKGERYLSNVSENTKRIYNMTLYKEKYA